MSDAVIIYHILGGEDALCVPAWTLKQHYHNYLVGWQEIHATNDGHQE